MDILNYGNHDRRWVCFREELWQFLARKWTCYFSIFYYFCDFLQLIMQISYRYRTNQFYPVLIELIGKRWAAAYDDLIVFYLFTTTVIMIAGGGATLEMWHAFLIGGELALLVLLSSLFFQED